MKLELEASNAVTIETKTGERFKIWDEHEFGISIMASSKFLSIEGTGIGLEYKPLGEFFIVKIKEVGCPI